MKKFVFLLLVLTASLSVPVQFLKSNAELAPRGDVHFIYSPSEFTPSPLTLKYSVGRGVSAASTPFTISGSDPVTVNNGVFTLSIYQSGEIRVIAGSEIVRMRPSIVYSGTVYQTDSSVVQVFPGEEMASILYQPFNNTFISYRVIRVWYNKPWIEVETIVSAENQTLIDLRESINNMNVGSSSADSMQVLLKDQFYEGPSFSSTIVPTEGWMLVYDGNDGFGLSIESDSWDLNPVGNDLNILAHKSLLLESGIQKKVTSYFQFMTYNLDFRSSQAKFRGGWKYRFNSSSDWTGGTVGQIDNQNRYENSTFFLPQPRVNATISSITLNVAGVVGSNPLLECSINGHQILEENVELPAEIVREVPARWLEWGDNTVTCYADGGNFLIPDFYISLSAVEGMSWVYGGSNWKYTSVNILSNSSADAAIDLDMRDLGITRDYPTVIVLDSNLNRINSAYTYPVLSFNSSVYANITNSFFVTFGNGEQLILSGPAVTGSFVNYTTSIFETGGFGPTDILRSVHREGKISKKQPGAATGGAKTMIYTDGSGALLNLVVWK